MVSRSSYTDRLILQLGKLLIMNALIMISLFINHFCVYSIEYIRRYYTVTVKPRDINTCATDKGAAQCNRSRRCEHI